MSEDNKRSEEQAKCQLASIREMVAALDKKAAAGAYAKNLTKEQCIHLLDEAFGVGCRDELSLDDLHDHVWAGIVDGDIEPEDFEFDEEAARQTIQEDALSVEMRSGWCSSREEMKPEEYMILLCTGGPACRIVGDLSDCGEPETAKIEHQDWFRPWVELRLDQEEEEDVVKYARCFWFGE